MQFNTITETVTASPQVCPDDLTAIREAGYRAVICNRPDGEAADQPTFEEIEAAAHKAGLEARYLPIVAGKVSDADADAFDAALTELPGPVLAYCRTGTRSATLWSLASADRLDPSEILSKTKAAGYDMAGVVRRIVNGGKTPTDTGDAKYDVVIVGGGAAGIAAAASILQRRQGLEIALIDPADIHYYQPGWTMVGGGVFDAATTAKTMGSLIPKGVHWLKSAVAAFEPKDNAVVLDGCRVVKYDRLIVAPGLKLDWGAVDGLVDTLGKNGVTSNYRYDLAPYTWELVKGLKEGRAIFTQPPMPIKCAGAPQKAMYLSANNWEEMGVLDKIDIEFMNAGGVLFGVKDYVPALESYVERYGATLNFLPQPDRGRRPREKGDLQGQRPRGGGARGHRRFRHDARHAAANRAGFHPGLAAGGCRRLGRRGPGHPAPQGVRQHLGAGRRDERPQRQDRRGRADAGPGGGRQPGGRYRRARAAGAVQRLRLLPADGGKGQDRPGRVRLWRGAATVVSQVADQRAETLAPGLAAQGTGAAARLLARHAARPRMDGPPRKGQRQLIPAPVGRRFRRLPRAGGHPCPVGPVSNCKGPA